MSDQEILQKACSKAIEGGWRMDKEWAKQFKINKVEGVNHYIINPNIVIYNHKFAKALWGDGQAGLSEANGHWYTQISPYDERSYIEVLDLWEYHLQQMVIDEDPIKYLGENLQLDN